MKKIIFLITLISLITLYPVNSAREIYGVILPIVPRVFAAGGTLKPGWNIVTWQNGWPTNTYSALPAGCDQLSVKKNGWFDSWVRNYSPNGTFEADRNYYIRCSSSSPWNF